jgi:hypothetical protein
VINGNDPNDSYMLLPLIPDWKRWNSSLSPGVAGKSWL